MVLTRNARIGLKIAAWILGLIIFTWIGLYIFLSLNTQKIKNLVISEFGKKVNADLQIGEVSPNFLNTFPFISLEFKDVIIRDSMWNSHKKDLLNTRYVYLRVSPVSLLSKSRVGRVIIRDGAIRIFTDSAGYSNQYILKGENKVTKFDSTDNKPPAIPDIALERVNVRFENPQRNKLHRATINKLICGVSRSGSALILKLDMSLKVDGIAFNTSKGPYIENTTLTGKFRVELNAEDEMLSFSNARLRINDHPYIFTGRFSTSNVSPGYHLNIKSREANFANTTEFLPDTLHSKLKNYSFAKPVDFDIDVEGVTQYKSQPRVVASMNVTNNSFVTGFGTIDNCSFKSTFTNEVDSTMAHLDPNSRLTIRDFSGKWGEIPLQSKSIVITHLKRPFLEADLKSDFNLKAFNELTGSSTLVFNGGTAHVDVVFKGPIGGTDSSNSSLSGNVSLSNAEFLYKPRNIKFTNGTGTLEFKDKDLLVRKLNVSTGKSNLVMNGAAKNLLSVLNISPEKLLLTWNIQSPNLHLDDFKGFLSSQNKGQTASDKKAVFKRTSGNIDKMFVEGDVHISLDAPKMNYKKFNASNVAADVRLRQYEVEIEKVAMRHAGGSMSLRGTMKDNGRYNLVNINTDLADIDIPQLFTAFNDFGQDAITQKNIKGKISAGINLNTAITDKAELVKEATSGTIDFNVENGELIRFEPMMKISETALKKQDMSHIKFADLKNTLEVKGTAFVINKMEIRSTAFTMFLEGIYDIVKGTDMSILFPLRNLTKDQANTDLSEDGGKGAGLAIRLRARTGDDGKLNVKWDPFRRSLRKKEKVVDSLKGN